MLNFVTTNNFRSTEYIKNIATRQYEGARAKLACVGPFGGFAPKLSGTTEEAARRLDQVIRYASSSSNIDIINDESKYSGLDQAYLFMS